MEENGEKHHVLFHEMMRHMIFELGVSTDWERAEGRCNFMQLFSTCECL